MFLSVLSSLLFLSGHLAVPYEDIYKEFRGKACDNSTPYTPNSTFSANLGQALDSLRNNTALTGFNATTVTNGGEPVTALALCRATLTPLECQTCVDAAALGIRQQCPNQTVAAVWYNFCMLRYSTINFLTRPVNTISFIEYDTRDAPQPDSYNQRVMLLMQNLSSTAGESDKRYTLGRTRLSVTHSIYSYVECSRDLRSEDCKTCLLTTTNRIESCCSGKWAVWICTPTCGIQFNLDPTYSDLLTVPEILTDPASPRPLSPTPSGIPTNKTMTNGGTSGKSVVIGVTAAAVGTVVLVVGCLCVVMKRRKRERMRRGGSRVVKEDNAEDMMTESVGIRSILFDFDILVAATENFSATNRLGSGGFGTVYKGRMPHGEEIAVKKLAVGSMQGVEELANEVRLLLKMQHRNLVKLLGCCVQGEAKMLVYEYLRNKSLDCFLFDKSKSALLDWRKRFNIILGIARGLLYLHEDSQFRIIHRDIKASNILLDEQMNPKISDFGLAKLFPDEQSHLTTRRIAGTYGYMAPEYAVRGLMSAKSDVFSFGVLMLEIISGRKNFDLQLDEQSMELLNLTWRLEQHGRLMELVDVTIGSFPEDEVLKCIKTGLLCCQESIRDRLTMSSALMMLLDNSVTVPIPGRPGYQGSRDNTMEASSTSGDASSNHENENVSNNTITASLVSGR